MPDKSDHDLIVEMHTALVGMDGNSGLVGKVDTLERIVLGDRNAVDDEVLKLGLLGMMRMQQIERRNIARSLKALAAVLGAVVLWVFQRIYTMFFHP